MAIIRDITNDSVQLQMKSGKIKQFPIDAINYEGAEVGDEVKLFRDEDGELYIDFAGQSSNYGSNSSEGTITFYRESHMSGIAIKTKVIIDGMEYGSLAVGQQLQVSLPYGSHQVQLKQPFYLPFSTVITIDDTNRNINYPFKVGMAGCPEPVIMNNTVTKGSDDSNSPLGIAGFVIGIIALILSFLPLINALAFYIGLVAIVLGIIGTFGRKKKSMSTAAIILGILSVVITVMFPSMWSITLNSGSTSAQFDSTNTASNNASATDETEPPEYSANVDLFDVYTTQYSDGYRYDGIVGITNTGSKNIYISGKSFDIEDSSGHLIQSDNFISNCPDVIMPGETGYLYNQLGSEINGVSNPDDLVLNAQYVVKTTSATPHEYPVTDVSTKADNYGGITVVGRVTNDTDEDHSLLYVQVLYYDESGNIIGISGTNLTDFLAGRTISFEISSMYLQNKAKSGNISTYKIVAREPFFGW